MKPILVFQTDFTYKEGAVSSMYGVVKSVDRELEIMDGTHELPQYDTWSASYRLWQSLPFWPEGTIYVSVVDPGVGTERRACVVKTSDGHYVVSPDNGSLTHVKRFIGIEAVRMIDESVNRLRGKAPRRWPSSTAGTCSAILRRAWPAESSALRAWARNILWRRLLSIPSWSL